MQKRNKPLGPLDVLLLVFLQSGLSTTYDLLKNLGIGVGTTSPALRRLEEQGILTRTTGPRDSMQFAVTREGKAQLKKAIEEGSERYWKHGGRDTFDNLRRAIFLNWASGRLGEAKRSLTQAYRDLDQLADKHLQEAERSRKSVHRQIGEAKESGVAVDAGVLLPTVYRWITAEMDTALYKSQVSALESVGELIDSLPATPSAFLKTQA